MNISLNGKPLSIDASYNLEQVLMENNIADKKGIAVAVNQQVVPKSNWQNTTLNSSDSIIVIQATQGG